MAALPSFPDRINTPLTISANINLSPGLSQIEVPPTEAARGLTVTVSFIFPYSMASSAVTIFVVLAGARLICSFLAYKMAPLSSSIRTAESAVTAGPLL